MNDTSPNAGPPAPIVDATAVSEIADGVFVIPDRRVPLVPNIGIVRGSDAVLVVDTGMGPANGGKVLEAARHIAGSRSLIVTHSPISIPSTVSVHRRSKARRASPTTAPSATSWRPRAGPISRCSAHSGRQ